MKEFRNVMRGFAADGGWKDILGVIGVAVAIAVLYVDMWLLV